MFQLLIALFLGFSSPQHSTSTSTTAGITAPADDDSDDIIGEGGHIPPKKP